MRSEPDVMSDGSARLSESERWALIEALREKAEADKRRSGEWDAFRAVFEAQARDAEALAARIEGANEVLLN